MAYENFEQKAKDFLIISQDENLTSSIRDYYVQLGIGYALLAIAQQINMIDNFGQK